MLSLCSEERSYEVLKKSDANEIIDTKATSSLSYLWANAGSVSPNIELSVSQPVFTLTAYVNKNKVNNVLIISCLSDNLGQQ